MGSRRSHIGKIVFSLVVLQSFCVFLCQTVNPPNVSSLLENYCSTNSNEILKDANCEVCDKSSKNGCRLLTNKDNVVNFYYGNSSGSVDNIKSEDVNKRKSIDVLEIFQKFPNSFIPDERASSQCFKDVKLFRKSLKKMELWALKMFDATAKMPSGVLSGNINQYGDFDECLSITAPIYGKYCLAALDVSLKESASDEIDSLVHSHYALSSNLSDLGHRVPRLSSIQWGVCIPSSCSSEDLQIVMEKSLQALNPTIFVDEKMCVSHETPPPFTTGKKFTIIFFVALAILIILGTIFGDDYEQSKIPKDASGVVHRILTGFSFKYNFGKFMDISMEEEVPGCDGIKAFNALALLLTHKNFALFYNPYVNKSFMANKTAEKWCVLARTAIIYTDAFLFISGFLSSRSLFKSLNQKGSMNFTQKLITRVFRILPLMLCIILFYTYLLPDLGEGPLWPVVVEAHSDLCKANMWNNFMFIHNYFGFEKMCLTHTHQLGIDMQLFIATPIAVALIWYKGKTGAFILGGASIVSTILRIWAVYSKEISVVIYFGMPVQKFFDTANFSYTMPTHRVSIYTMGIALAYFMSLESSGKFVLSKVKICSWWLICFVSLSLAIAGPYHMGMRGYVYNTEEAALYSAVSPYLSGICSTWIILSIHNGYGGIVGDIFSWRGFRYVTKIAYALYLTQFPIFFYNIGSRKTSDYYSTATMLDLPEIGSIFAISVFLTLVVEMPFSNLCKVILGEDKRRRKIKTTEGNGKQDNTKLSHLNNNGVMKKCSVTSS